MTRRSLICCSLFCSVLVLGLCWHFNVPSAIAAVARYASASDSTGEPSHHHRRSQLTDLTGISSHDFGWAGPINISTLYNSQVGYTTDVTASVAIGDRFALAGEFEGGSRNIRASGTLGFGFTPASRLKTTYEFLRQKLDFSFITGSDRYWVDQSAIGLEYEQLLGAGMLDSISMGGYYVHSRSKELEDVAYTVGMTNRTNRRHIAGADAANVNLAVKYHLWPKSQLKTGFRWDTIHYRTKYENDADVDGVGIMLGLDQLLSDRVKVSVDSSLNRIDNSVGGELGVLLPAPHTTRLELAYITDYTYGRTTHRNFYSNGARVAFSWGYPSNQKPSYVDDFGEPSTLTQSLRQWTTTPAVRMAEVLAIADETSVDGMRRRSLRGMVPDPENGEITIESVGGSGKDKLDFSNMTMDSANQNLRWVGHDSHGMGLWIEKSFEIYYPPNTDYNNLDKSKIEFKTVMLKGQHLEASYKLRVPLKTNDGSLRWSNPGIIRFVSPEGMKVTKVLEYKELNFSEVKGRTLREPVPVPVLWDQGDLCNGHDFTDQHVLCSPEDRPGKIVDDIETTACRVSYCQFEYTMQ